MPLPPDFLIFSSAGSLRSDCKYVDMVRLQPCAPTRRVRNAARAACALACSSSKAASYTRLSFVFVLQSAAVSGQAFSGCQPPLCSAPIISPSLLVCYCLYHSWVISLALSLSRSAFLGRCPPIATSYLCFSPFLGRCPQPQPCKTDRMPLRVHAKLADPRRTNYLHTRMRTCARTACGNHSCNTPWAIYAFKRFR